MDIETLEKLIKGRRTIRQWKKEDVPDELLKKAVELGAWAPNGGNYQGWHFIVVKNRALIQRMGNALQSVTDKIASWPEAIKEDFQRAQKFIGFLGNAPACIAVFTREFRSDMDKVLIARESFDPEAKQILSFRRSAPTALQSAAAAVTTMLLVFHDMGLGAVWMAAPLLVKSEIEKILNVSTGLSLVCMIAVGYPDESPQKDRKPVDQILTFIH